MNGVEIQLHPLECCINTVTISTTGVETQLHQQPAGRDQVEDEEALQIIDGDLLVALHEDPIPVEPAEVRGQIEGIGIAESSDQPSAERTEDCPNFMLFHIPNSQKVKIPLQIVKIQ